MPRRTVAALLGLECGRGFRLASRGAAQDPRRLGRLLPRLRARAALLRGVRCGAPERVSRLRRGDAVALSRVRCAVLLRVRRRVRGVRRGTSSGRGLRRAGPQTQLQVTQSYLAARATTRRALRAADLGEADERDDVLFRHVPVVELPEKARHVLGAADLRVVVLALTR